VSEVLLDALVTDRDGNVIVGLGPDDFIVEEQGKPMPVTGVSFYSNRRFLDAPPESAGVSSEPAPIPEERFLIFMFEDQREASMEANGLLARQLDAGRQLKAWVRMKMLSSDWAAVLSYDRSLHLHQDFTHDRGVVERAIDDAAAGRESQYRFPSRRAPAPEGAPSLVAGLPEGDSLMRASTSIYDGLKLVATASAPIRGRKNLVLFTRGFGKISSFGMYRPDTVNYPPMQQALNTANVAVYAIDVVPTGTSHLMADGMNQLAADTGGKYLYNFTTFATPLEQIARDTSGYYLLSFQASHDAGTQGFQKVSVKTRNPEFRVRARQGYSFGN
ncbi:MAG: VWA domain-containing protein, partial [Acidobacteriota bacterium]